MTVSAIAASDVTTNTKTTTPYRGAREGKKYSRAEFAARGSPAETRPQR